MKKYTRRNANYKTLIVTITIFIVALSTIYIPQHIFSTASAGSESSPVQPTPTPDPNSLHTAPLNPDFIDYINNPPSPSNGYIPPPMDLSLIPEVIKNDKNLLTANPGLSYFDWRTSGKVTPVKNQDNCGSCWAFGTISAVESRVLIGESTVYDFSEQNLVCCTDPSFVYLTNDRCHGGWSSEAADTLIKKGTRLESCQPYNIDTIYTESCYDSCPTIKMLNGYRLVTNNGSEISRIKDAIYDYGPVSMSLNMSSGHLYTGYIYYWPSCTENTNHLVSIVGWDDSIPHPAGGGYGAWIVKNSWDTSWGNSGYFYLCYGSANMQEVAYYSYQNYNPNEKLYYWDEAGWLTQVGAGVNYGWMASVFTSTQSGNITTADFWVTSSNAQYQVYIYNGNFGTLLTSQSGNCSEAGYYSIPLNSPVHRNVGQQFTVAVKITTPGYNGPISVEEVVTDWWEPTIQTGVSYLRIEDSDSWEDAASYDWNVCLRARIVNDPYILTLNASPAAGGNPTGAGIYNASTNASISANTSPRYTFAGWTPTAGIANASAENTAVSMTQNRSLTANYIKTYTLGTQEWTQISIPDTGDMQLAPNTDVGVIAVSSDGATLFAAVVSESTGGWSVYKSVNGGYTWKVTGYNGDGTPTEQIVAIDMSPNWANDDRIYVATQDDVYSSNDRGKTFNSRNAITDSDGVSINYITSMDVGLDEDGDAVVVIGSDNSFAPDPDVYILGEGGWDAQGIYYSANGGYGVTSNNYGVLSVAFSPNYGEDGVVFAAIRGYAPLEDEGTHLRAESDITVNNWGSYIRDGHFVDEETLTNIVADSACMDFADDYNSVPLVFVGLTAYNGSDSRGDAFRVDLVTGSMGTSAITDLNIRGVDSRTNVNSLAVSGEASSAFILAGLRDLSNTGPMSTWQGQVHYSQNGGESWMQSYKPPSGFSSFLFCAPIVVMSPDFTESGIAYCGNGYIPGATEAFSGFYASTTQGTTWNGRGLLDHDISEITDIVPSPDYDDDGTMFMVTHDADFFGPSQDFGLLWETKDGGNTWELILGMTLMQPLPGVNIDTIRLPATYPDEPSVFVTGPNDLLGDPSARVVRSTDEGNLFASTFLAPYSEGVPLVVDTWVVIDDKTLIVSNGSSIFKTTDMGAHWNLPTQADIDVAAGETIIDMQRYKDTATLLVGTNCGNMFICNDWENDFSFTEVGQSPCITGDLAHVSFDTNFEENGFVYAGIFGINCGIWRVDANSAGEWEQIWDTEDIYSIACDGNGILWAIDDNGIRSAAIRCVSPTAPIDGLEFEYITNGLTSDLWSDLEITPTRTHVFAIGGASNNELWAIIPPIGFYGDANRDSVLNLSDYTSVQLMRFGKRAFNPGGDANRDGVLNLSDYTTVQLMRFGKRPIVVKYEVSYDFLSGRDSNKWAKIKTISLVPPGDNFDNESGWSEAGPTDYSNISLTDSNVWSITGTPGNYSALQCKFTIVNNPINITSIGVTLNGSSNINGSTLRLWAWNFTTNSWTQIGSNFTTNTSISSYAAWTAWGKVYTNYIDPDDYMFILASLNTSAADFNIDYIKLSVAHP